MKKITLEFDAYCLCENSFGFVPNKTEKPVKNAKAWEVITVENSIRYTPGQCLTEKEVKTLCNNKTFHVQIGPRGQFKKKKK